MIVVDFGNIMSTSKVELMVPSDMSERLFYQELVQRPKLIFI